MFKYFGFLFVDYRNSFVTTFITNCRQLSIMQKTTCSSNSLRFDQMRVTCVYCGVDITSTGACDNIVCTQRHLLLARIDLMAPMLSGCRHPTLKRIRDDNKVLKAQLRNKKIDVMLHRNPKILTDISCAVDNAVQQIRLVVTNHTDITPYIQDVNI